ncbi:MAG: hopanoid-associated sugar epimerase, partial [Opitutales bacterium]
MTTLLTGATGFVGSAVARALLAKGDNVRVTARPGADRTNLKGLNLQIVAADLNDTASLRDALDGCDTLYHVAADYRLWAPRPQEMLRTNVEGTRALMLAALDAGVQRIVYCSSVAVLGLHKDGSLADEETPSTLSDMIGVYKQSKFLAEVAVRELVKEKSLPAVIVNPAAPIGPRDIRPTPTGQMIFDAVRGKMPGFLNTGLNVVHVDDVAAGHLLAAEQGQIGRRYILGGDNMTMEEILGVVARELGQKPPKWKVPYALAYTAGC